MTRRDQCYYLKVFVTYVHFSTAPANEHHLLAEDGQLKTDGE